MEKVKSRMEYRKYKKSNAITLIALIITIIIMLILLAVTISILVKSNIIGIAESTADKTKTAYEKESNLTEITIDGEKYGSIDDYTDSITPMPEIKAGERAARTSKYIDGGKTAIIPKGFTVSAIKSDTADETTIEGGLVIYDIPAADLADSTKVNWSNPDTVKTKYNQFVWIPVEVNKTVEPVDTTLCIQKFSRGAWENNERTSNNEPTKNSIPSTMNCRWSEYTEPYSWDNGEYDGTNGTGIASQISELTESIYNYEGFYIGRYEAGVSGTTPRTSSSSQTDPLVIQQDKYPYNYIKWGTDMSTVSTEGAVYLSNNLYAKTNTNYGATSMLCTGACWDVMLDFIKDNTHNVTSSINWGNFSNESFTITRGEYATCISTYYQISTSDFQKVNSEYNKQIYDAIKLNGDVGVLLTTGATDRNSAKNIYDIAGNCYEWTTEARGIYFRVLRGGSCYSDGRSEPACRRGDVDAYMNDSLYSFRPIIYIK